MRTKSGIWKLLAVSMAVGTFSVGCGGGDSESSNGGYNYGPGGGGEAGAAGSSATGGKAGTAGSAGKAGAGASSGKGGSGQGGGEVGGAGGSTGGKAGAGGSTGGSGGKAGAGNAGGSTGGTAGAGNTGNTGGTAGAGNAGGGTGGSDVGGSAGAGNTGNTGGTGGSDVGGSAGAGNTGNAGGTAGAGNAGGSTGGTAGAGNTGNTGGSGGNCGLFGCAGQGGSTGGSAGSQGACLHTDPNVDFDKDGYFPPADCNDCDPNTNPGALDILNVDVNGNALPPGEQVDEDCSGAPTQASDPPTCDSGAFAVADSDPNHGANAADICQKATESTVNGKTVKTPGIMSAAYTQINGNTPIPPGGEVGYGILSHFGTAVNPQLGKSFLVLSSGTARNPTDPGYQDPGGADKGYASTNPVGFPLVNACGNTADLHDSAALKLKLRAPTNAHSFSFKFKFYTFEFPTYVCTQYNDVFIATMSPPPPDPKVKADMNISFDPQGNPLSVNAAFLDVCTPVTTQNPQPNGKKFDCPAGTAELAGTGYEMHGGTTWLQTTAPVNPGEEFTLTFAITDSGDGVLASTVIIDDFQWSANAGEVNTGNACLLGGTGTCAPCLGVATNAQGCCVNEYDACTSDNTSGGCNKLLSCITLCNGNVGCEDQCHASHAAGEPAYDTLFKCLYGDPADPKNLGACGVACKGP